MNVNIYLEEALANSLNDCAKKSGLSRNAIIREAVKEWIIHHGIKTWSQSIFDYKGFADAPTFESFRDDLLPPDDENPLI